MSVAAARLSPQEGNDPVVLATVNYLLQGRGVLLIPGMMNPDDTIPGGYLPHR